MQGLLLEVDISAQMVDGKTDVYTNSDFEDQ